MFVKNDARYPSSHPNTLVETGICKLGANSTKSRVSTFPSELTDDVSALAATFTSRLKHRSRSRALLTDVSPRRDCRAVWDVYGDLQNTEPALSRNEHVATCFAIPELYYTRRDFTGHKCKAKGKRALNFEEGGVG
ncbi:hypothetical protein J6590_078430 [Homalodisca vitripennis]|nr:hypothetical protein J6590_078430 [Homalodisca vitripennis]